MDFRNEAFLPVPAFFFVSAAQIISEVDDSGRLVSNMYKANIVSL